MPIEPLPIFCYYDRQRFTQFGSMDCANWYGIAVESGKKKQALYPCMGRKHIEFLGRNRLIFNAEPRTIFKSINFMYVVDGTNVWQIDKFYNARRIGEVALGGAIWNATLSVDTLTYVMITDGINCFLITETIGAPLYQRVTDTLTPTNPTYVATFGNRFVVSIGETPNYQLTQINLGDTTPINVAKIFTIPDGISPGSGFALFNRASGIIRQFAVLHNQLYIFTDFTADVWSNLVTQITVSGITREFPWKLNSSYNFDYGMADPFSLAVDFGRMVWLAQNQDGLVSFMATTGQQPDDISTQAINIILEESATLDVISPFIEETAEGFLYQYENTIFYRVSARQLADFGNQEIVQSFTALEYNFETRTWGRVIELNGDRNRISKHCYFSNKHLVTLIDDPAIYDMAGNIYFNEIKNPEQMNTQAPDAFIKYPMRYELITEHIFLDDYAEFKDNYVEIDFVFGDSTFYKSNAPFLNTQFVVSQQSTPDSPVYVVSEDDKFIITEGSNTPTFDDNHYNALFKPHIELYYSDDGGVTFTTADLREFSPLGQYRWRMRWYELGASRNRCYKLICVSSAPIVILGAVRDTQRISGGAN